jgi:glycosyltransferase involved in cell wall biosynthesis
VYGHSRSRFGSPWNELSRVRSFDRRTSASDEGDCARPPSHEHRTAQTDPREQASHSILPRRARGGSRLPLREQSTLAPFPTSDFPRLYNAADVFALPTADLEMFGIAALETEACRVPAVASDHGELRETLPTQWSARFPPGDAVAFAKAVEAD